MNTKSRTSNSFKNMAIVAVCQIISLLFSFVTRTYFIQLLGTDYLGIHGLYTNILSVLSMADLGFSAAISFALYKPVAEGNEREITALMNFFKKVYRIIAVCVSVVGLGLVPFLKYLINTEQPVDTFHIVLYYLLFLANSVTSYLLVYKSTILFADQNSYITRISHNAFLILANIGELVVLYFTKSYTAYLIIQVSCTFLNNLVISTIVDKKYRFLKNYNDKLPDKQKKNIFQNVKYMFFYKIGDVIVNNTDNILISAIISTTVTGFYSNYTLIVGSVQALVYYVFNSITGSIGNLNAVSDPQKSEQVFGALTLFNFWLYGFCSTMLYTLLDDFIRLWLHKESFVLGTATLIIIVFNFFLAGIMKSMTSFRETTGIFKQTRFVFAFTAVLNIILSIIMGKLIGLNGILLATIISKLATCFWYEPYMLYKHYFKSSPKRYFSYQFLFVLTEAAVCVAIYFIKLWLPSLSYMSFVLETVMAAVLCNIVYLAVFGKTSEFKFLLQKLKSIIKR